MSKGILVFSPFEYRGIGREKGVFTEIGVFRKPRMGCEWGLDKG